MRRTCAKASFESLGKCEDSFEHTKIVEANSELMGINLVQTVEEYLNSLPGLAVQTRRHLFGNDLNI